jgi:hypothetical protein
VDRPVVFRCKVDEAQARAIREGILNAGLDIAYQEEQRGAALVLVVKCKGPEAQTVNDILTGAGVTPTDDIWS